MTKQTKISQPTDTNTDVLREVRTALDSYPRGRAGKPASGLWFAPGELAAMVAALKGAERALHRSNSRTAPKRA